MTDIKKVIQKIYDFDLSGCELTDGEEMVATDHGNEFVNTFIRRDLDRGIIVTPSGYQRGLIYKSTNGGEFYNCPSWMPDIVTFAFNLYGLKKNAFYRLTIEGRNASRYNQLADTTDDRTIEVSNNDQELLIKKDLSENMTNIKFDTVFKASGVEETLRFRIGKIYVSDIIIEEVEIAMDMTEEVEAPQSFEFDMGKSNIVAFGVFAGDNVSRSASKYTEIPRVTGKGINLYFDNKTNEYILERDNYEDTIFAPFTLANYVVDFCFTKAPHASYEVCDVCNDASPNTLKQGYIRFKIYNTTKPGEPVFYQEMNGRLSFVVRKII